MSPTTKYSVRRTGEPLTENYRVYLTTGNEVVSPWHEIPLFPPEKESQVVNMVVEIPRWSNVRMEIAKDEFLTPIRQATRNNKLRYIPNIFPHKGYPWNYGALPQTWEDPNLSDPHTQLPGDSDPLDVCELAGEVSEPGVVKQVKVLGTFAVIDEGQTDWKVVVVDVSSPLAVDFNDIGDVEAQMPGYLDTMVEWFRVCKIPDGAKEKNEIALDGDIKGKDFALALIARHHGSWKKVMTEPAMKTKVSMADIGIEDINLAQQLRPEIQTNGLTLADRLTIEKYHYLSPNWPLAASCPSRTMEI